ncbi:MAG: hypothetical protein ACR2NB_08295 [Solirubrobacteraceae bacterium]
MRRLAPALLGLILVAAGIYGLLAVFSHRDSSQLRTDAAAQAPGRLEPLDAGGSPPTSGSVGADPLTREIAVSDPVLLRALALGDVAFVYDAPRPPAALRRLRDDVTGPFDPELSAAGQMAFLVRRRGVRGIEALAWRRRYRASGPDDPQLRAFVDAWLGKGRGNAG